MLVQLHSESLAALELLLQAAVALQLLGRQRGRQRGQRARKVPLLHLHHLCLITLVRLHRIWYVRQTHCYADA